MKELLERMARIVSGEKVYVESFRVLKKQREMNVLRNYINSLWRWKTSNIEAQYYTKFINIFRESEELLSFSRILNSKLNSIYHHVFSRLRNQNTRGAAYQTAIIAKYLSKRVSSYFALFRRNLKQKEVEFWRNRFQSSIKGISVVNAFEKAQRKFTFYVLKVWRHRANKKTAQIQAASKMDELILQWGRKRFGELVRAGKERKLGITLDMVQEVLDALRWEGFNAIKVHSVLGKLVEALKSYEFSNVATAFDKINSKSSKGFKTKNLLLILNTLCR